MSAPDPPLLDRRHQSALVSAARRNLRILRAQIDQTRHAGRYPEHAQARKGALDAIAFALDSLDAALTQARRELQNERKP